MSSKALLPKLASILHDSHKHVRGHALIIAGSKEKSGAAILSSLASMRSGVGLCTLALPSAAHTIIKGQLINVMSEEIASDEQSNFQDSALNTIPMLVKKKSAVLMGPGLAPDENRETWINKILASINVPFVLDAQALSDIGTDIGNIDWSKNMAVITPHEGEMSKLTGLSVEEIHANRSKVATNHAKKWNVHVILKGFHTVVASPNGEIWINDVDHPCLSVAGTGDVLAGILVSLLAQGVPMVDACRLSVYIHGRTGQRLGEKIGVRGVLASDLLPEIPHTLHELDYDQNTNS